MAAVMGESPFASPYSLWWEKKEGWDHGDTEEMSHGRGLEAYVAKAYAGTLGPDVTLMRPPHALYMHASWPWMLATPDRLLWWNHSYVPVEIKTDEGGGWGEPGTDEIPDHHKIQLMQQMAVFGSDIGILVRFAHKHLTTYTVKFDPDLLERMVHAGEAFMASLAADEPPPIDAHKSTGRALKKLNPGVDEDRVYVTTGTLYEQWARTKAALKQAKQDAELIDNVLRDAMGDAGKAATPDGEVFVARSISARRGFTVKPTIVDRLVPRKVKGEDDSDE